MPNRSPSPFGRVMAAAVEWVFGAGSQAVTFASHINANWYTSAIDTYDICFVLDV